MVQREGHLARAKGGAYKDCLLNPEQPVGGGLRLIELRPVGQVRQEVGEVDEAHQSKEDGEGGQLVELGLTR